MKNKVIAIVGRPNVGKSTFVNRIVGARKSIVDDMPGVTRDRIYFDAEWSGKNFTLIDTGGIVIGDDDEIMNSIFLQAQIALDEADEILFIVDGKDGATSVDVDLANFLRRSKKKVHLVANKIDSYNMPNMAGDLYELGLGEPHLLSALHGSGGVGDILDVITEDIEVDNGVKDETSIKIAIVGKPNAGKSSIVNALSGENRVIVSEISGTTRDSIDLNVKYNDQNFTIVDTAGIRRKSRVDYGVEAFAVDRSIRAIRESDVALLVIDATKGISDQDKKIAQTIVESGRAMVVAFNKWDLLKNVQTHVYEKEVEDKIPYLAWAPKIYISAKGNQRLDRIFDEAIKVHEQWSKRVSTSILNKIMYEAIAMNIPASVSGKRLRLYYTTQVKAQPPTFVLFINDERLIKDSYSRYLEKRLREAFGFFGTPIQLSYRQKKEK